MIGPMRGRSAYARLQLAGYDVGAQMAIGPIMEWAKAVWDSLVPRDQLNDAWKLAMTTVAGAAKPFNAAVGPAGAMVASLARLGWKSPAPTVIKDGQGHDHYLDYTCPIELEKVLMDAQRAVSVGSQLCR